ncbi:MAG TPA: hypothetical protein VNN73_19955 [Blastocatellia bacterium]|nr:hypothetical protein [Blastocatellia bacterium]
MWFLLTVILGGGLLIAYVMIEKRINLRPCLECGYKVSVDALPEQCPRCGEMIEPDLED